MNRLADVHIPAGTRLRDYTLPAAGIVDRVHRNPEAALSYLAPMAHHLNDYGLGTLGEIFDGQPPFAPRGCIAQAWTVAEVLRAWHLIHASTNKHRTEHHTPQK